MRSAVIVSVAMGLLYVMGCGGGDTIGDRVPVEPTLDFANSVESMVMRLKNADKKSLGINIDIFLENYAEYESQALGDNKETYDSIAQVGQELKSLKDGGANIAELRKKVNELVKLANQLKGKPAE